MKNPYKRVILLTVQTKKRTHTQMPNTKCIVTPNDVSKEEKSVGEKEQSYDLVQCKENNFLLELISGRRRRFSFLKHDHDQLVKYMYLKF